ncbi:MAG: hypothetical protein R3D59_13945 [Paracoccaceae bacterium]|nr:hypothetical protein [Maritimibacter sp.]
MLLFAGGSSALSQQLPVAEIAPMESPELCGTYYSGSVSMTEYFSGGEGGAIALSNPRRVESCCLTFAFEGVMTEEGFREPVGEVRITFARWAYSDVYFVELGGETFEYVVCN